MEAEWTLVLAVMVEVVVVAKLMASFWAAHTLCYRLAWPTAVVAAQVVERNY